MKKPTNEPSLREREIAFRTSEARRLNFHPAAVEMARTRLSIPMPVVELYSRHEKALDYPLDDVLRDTALRQVFQSVIHYARYGALPEQHKPIPPHEDYAAEQANPSREDATEAA